MNSPLPLANISPSGLNSTQCTGPWCPFRTSLSSPDIEWTRTHSSVRLPVTNRSWCVGWIDADDGQYGKVITRVRGPLGICGMRATVFPDVTTSCSICEDSSIEVIGFEKVIVSIIFLLLRSHHLWKNISEGICTKAKGHYLIFPSSPALTPACSPMHTTLLITPSCVCEPLSYRKSGSVSGLFRSKILTFFSCPPVKRWVELGDIETVRTIWLWGNECSIFPEYVSQTFL